MVRKLTLTAGKLSVILIVNLFLSSYLMGQINYQYPYQNPTLSVEVRVTDLVMRMTIDEKISQMMNTAPAIDRLGVPAYDWWNECLHGVARSGLATVFPQAIGLGATWDEDLIFRVSATISDEARAKHHEYVRNSSRRRYQGLTFWTPNINIFRDPRWGRGQETYGEDPFLTGNSEVLYAQDCEWAAGMPGQRPAEELKAEALEVARKANAVIMCMGITPRLEGEEMKVNVDGFKGGDRTSLDLPAIQEDLIKSVYALGKPVILVLLNGSALSINWEKENLPAILESWYGGQAAGQAIAAGCIFSH